MGGVFMMNFSFLSSKPEYALFSSACIEAEKIYDTAPAMCAVGCRKALEFADVVSWQNIAPGKDDGFGIF